MSLTNDSAAVAAVFATTELLEDILMHIDMKTVLLAQRVNRKFNGVISSSPWLQKKLFMLPATIEEAIKCVSNEHYVVDQGFILVEAVGFKTERRGRKAKLFNVHITNPLLLRRMTVSHLPPCYNFEWLNFDRSLRSRDNMHGNPIEGSWKRMYLAHPCTLPVMAEMQINGQRYYESEFVGGDVLDTTVGMWQEKMAIAAMTRYQQNVNWGKSGVRAYVNVVMSKNVVGLENCAGQNQDD